MNKKEKIKLLLQMTNMGRSIERGFRTLVEDMPDDLFPQLGEIKKRFLAKFDEIYEESLGKQVELFDSLLSETAVDGSLAFYGSPAGLEVIDSLPKINEGLSELSGELAASMAKDLIEELLKLEPSDEQMESMGFVKLDHDDPMGDMERRFGKSSFKPKKKFKFKVNDDDIDDDEFDRFANDWLK